MPLGRAYWCKHCRNAFDRGELKGRPKVHPKRLSLSLKEKSARYRQEHREEYRQHQRQKAREIKMEIFSHYSWGTPQCARCKIKDMDVLTIDHIKGNGAEERKSLGWNGQSGHFYRWLKRNDFPPHYQVLCYNCNMKKARLKPPHPLIVPHA